MARSDYLLAAVLTSLPWTGPCPGSSDVSQGLGAVPPPGSRDQPAAGLAGTVAQGKRITWPGTRPTFSSLTRDCPAVNQRSTPCLLSIQPQRTRCTQRVQTMRGRVAANAVEARPLFPIKVRMSTGSRHVTSRLQDSMSPGIVTRQDARSFAFSTFERRLTLPLAWQSTFDILHPFSRGWSGRSAIPAPSPATWSTGWTATLPRRCAAISIRSGDTRALPGR